MKPMTGRDALVILLMVLLVLVGIGTFKFCGKYAKSQYIKGLHDGLAVTIMVGDGKTLSKYH